VMLGPNVYEQKRRVPQRRRAHPRSLVEGSDVFGGADTACG